MGSPLLPLLCLLGSALAQFPGASLFSNSWSQGIFPESLSQPFGYGQPIRPSPYGYGYGSPAGSASSGSYEDPIPAIAHDDAPPAFDVNKLPAKLPIRAPNGVVEIYNRVVDDLLSELKVEFRRRDIDPMDVVIRPTPPGPVRVPGHLQKRPFRRPGAALYRANHDSLFAEGTGRKAPQGERKRNPFPEITAVHKGDTMPDDEDKKSDDPSSEEHFFKVTGEKISERKDGLLKRSDVKSGQKRFKGKNAPKVTLTEDEEDAAEGKKDVEILLQKYQQKNQDEQEKNEKTKKKSGGKKKKEPTVLEEDVEDEAGEEEDDESYDDDLEPGTLQSGGHRPSGGYYPQGGPPPIPPLPNAQLSGLSRIRRTSDVVVSVDARSAVITARLRVGPVIVFINESMEPQEEHMRATIPELEAEMSLMERHGVVMLQRFTLDRPYGEDIEISIPKRRAGDKKRKKGSGSAPGDIQGFNLAAEQRYHTKMAAHFTMEVVRLLRSGNLRVNIMRTAQSAMGQLKLPIKANKKSKKKGQKGRRNQGRS